MTEDSTEKEVELKVELPEADSPPDDTGERHVTQAQWRKWLDGQEGGDSDDD